MGPRGSGESERIASEEPAQPPSRRERRRAEERRRATRARRRNGIVLLALVALVAGIATGAGRGGSSSGGDGGDQAAKAKAPPPPTLPGGGRTILPDRRVVAFYGAPQDEELGVLGIGSPAEAGRKLVRQAAAFRSPGVKVLPAMELIATVVNRDPGGDGKYRTRLSDATIRRYLKAARRVHALLILDIQPGRADFPSEARALEKWLREPDVSLALDPEWRMQPGQIPGQTIGAVDAAEVNSVSRWLGGVIRRGRLPQKLLVIHQFTQEMIRDRTTLVRPPGVAPVLNVDGFGQQAQKKAKYRELAQRRLANGFKLFYKEDTQLMKPAQVEALRPQPKFVIYE